MNRILYFLFCKLFHRSFCIVQCSTCQNKKKLKKKNMCSQLLCTLYLSSGYDINITFGDTISSHNETNRFFLVTIIEN